MTQASFATHEVFNQSPPFVDVDLFAVDRPLLDAVAANGGAAAAKELSEFGRHWGSAAMAARGRIANENPPKLRTFDARGIGATWSSSIRPITRSWRERPCRHSQFDLDADGKPAAAPPRSRARRATTWRRRSRPGTVPDHHDPRLGRGARRRSRTCWRRRCRRSRRAPTIRALRRGGQSAA